MHPHNQGVAYLWEPNGPVGGGASKGPGAAGSADAPTTSWISSSRAVPAPGGGGRSSSSRPSLRGFIHIPRHERGHAVKKTCQTRKTHHLRANPLLHHSSLAHFLITEQSHHFHTSQGHNLNFKQMLLVKREVKADLSRILDCSQTSNTYSFVSCGATPLD